MSEELGEVEFRHRCICKSGARLRSGNKSSVKTSSMSGEAGVRRKA